MKAVPQEQPFPFPDTLFKNKVIDRGEFNFTHKTRYYPLHAMRYDTLEKYYLCITESENELYEGVVFRLDQSDHLFEILRFDSILSRPVIYSFHKGISIELEIVKRRMEDNYLFETHQFYDITRNGKKLFSYTDVFVLDPDDVDNNGLISRKHNLKYKDLNHDGKLDLKLKMIEARKKERNCSCDSKEFYNISKKTIFF